jgi:acyl phosphate:glycerol-3-phosphate acyltransferase
VPGPAAGIAAAACSFLVGAIPWGYLAGRAIGGVDLRTVGSGSTGATNVLRTLGKQVSAAVFVLDLLKGLAPIIVAKALGFESGWLAAVAVAAVAGHCWSPFIHFKGGKGVATGTGAVLALFPPVIVVVPLVLAVIWVTRLVSVGSLLAVLLATAMTIGAAALGKIDWTIPAAVAAISAIVFVRHADNIRRLRQGTERRLGEKVTA